MRVKEIDSGNAGVIEKVDCPDAGEPWHRQAATGHPAAFAD
jgi:hypothetical protein